MKKTANLLLIYSCAFAIFITITSIIASPTPQTILSQLFFLPVVLFLFVKVFQLLKKSGTDSAPSITKRHILLFLVFLIILVGIGISSVSKSQKLQVINQSEKMVIKRPELIPSPFPTPGLPEIMIDSKNLGFLNVRKEPSTSSEILTTVKDKDIFEVHEKIGNWYKIQFEDDRFGYININYTQDLSVSTESGELNEPL